MLKDMSKDMLLSTVESKKQKTIIEYMRRRSELFGSIY